MTIKRINPVARWSDAVIFNGITQFVEVPECEGVRDIEGQVKQVLSQAEQSLIACGSDRTKVLSVTIYLTDFANMEGLNKVWDSWFPEGSAPSRACVKVELADPDWLVEMAFTAAVKEG